MSGVVASCRIPPARSGLRRVAGPTQAVGDDDLVTTAPLLERVGDWSAFLSLPADEDEVDILRRHQRTGRPLGDDAFVERLETSLGRNLHPANPAPSPAKRQGSREISNMSLEPVTWWKRQSSGECRLTHRDRIGEIR
jgi:hypothetical protein